MLETRERPQRLLPHGLILIVVLRDLHQQIRHVLHAAVAGIEGPGKPTDGGTSRLARRILIARQRQQSWSRIHAVSEHRREDRIATHASFGVFGEREQVLHRVARSHFTEIRHAGRRLRYWADEGRDRNHLPTGAIEHDADRSFGARISAIAVVPRPVPRIAGDLDEGPSVAAHARPCRKGELRSEEHTSELQSLTNLVCRLLLEKKNT